MYTLEQISQALSTSWSAYTAFDKDDWSPTNPARGQCVVSSLIVQDLLGGQLQKTKAVVNGNTESHYRNVLPDGRIVDVTRSQYADDQILNPSEFTFEGYSSIKEKLLDQGDTKKRYKLLRTQVLQKLS